LKKKQQREKMEAYSNQTVIKFLRKHRPYKMEIGDYHLIYVDCEFDKGVPIMRYKLVNKR